MKNNLISDPNVLGKSITSTKKHLDKRFDDQLKNWLIDNLWRKINSKNQSEKSRTVSIEGKEYTRSVSEFFATSKNFKNHIELGKDFKEKRKAKEEKISKDQWSKFEFVDSKYISWQDIINSDTKENLQLNLKIIQAIVSEQYKWSWFEFLKASGLVEFDPKTGKILKSELTSYRDSDGDWYDGRLGNYGYICLRAVNSDGNPIYVRFDEDSANWHWSLPVNAMRVGSEK